MKHLTRSLLTLPVLFTLAACTTRGPYRNVHEKKVAEHLQAVREHDDYRGKLSEQSNAVRNVYPEREGECLEKYSKSKFWLGHVEFTDYGSFQDHKQLDVLERAVQADLTGGGEMFRHGMTMLVFVHGWHNNAKDDNPNLEDFRMLLDAAARREREHPMGVGGKPRGVLGVYISWRGESVTLPFLKYLTTYWGRKRVAHDFGHGNLVETLARLKNLEWLVARGGREYNPPNESVFAKCRMVCVGHSFGAAALYSAVSQSLEARFLEPYWDKRRYGTGAREEKPNRMDRVAGIGDLIVLINPAFEALPYRSLHHAMSTNTNVRYDADQSVLMMVLTSRNDWPNQLALPVGQTLGHRFLDWFAWSNQRTEAKQRTTALGHFAGYHTHQLDFSADRKNVVLRRNPAFFGYGLTKSEDGEEFDPPKPIVTLEKDYQLHKHCPDESGSHVHLGEVSYDDIQALPEVKNRPKLAAKDIQGPGLLPFMVVSVNKHIINGHNGFWPVKNGQGFDNDAAYQFLRTFIAAQNQAVSQARKTEAREGQALHQLR
jgi:predicted small lipoprotein YifL